MAGTLSEIDKSFKFVERLSHLEEVVQGLRTNQVKKIRFGNITLDGTGAQGTITIGNRITITVDSLGNGVILVSDGTNDRILIGYQSGGF